MTPTHQAAKRYLKRGVSVIPCVLTWSDRPGKADKKPLVDWTDWQHRRPTEADIDAWWRRWPDAQVGAVTGRISDFFVVDVDAGYDPEDLKALALPPTQLARTPSGGFHYYFRMPEGSVKTQTKFRPRIDIRGDGGFIVLPPSRYPDGRPYEWVIIGGLTSAPAALVKEVVKPCRLGIADLSPIIHGVEEGRRNDSAVKLAGFLLRHLPPRSWGDVAWPLILYWNEHNRPPDDVDKLRLSFQSIADRETARRRKDYADVERQDGVSAPVEES